MNRPNLLVLTLLFCAFSGSAMGADEKVPRDQPAAIQFADLGKNLDGKDVTVQFQVDEVYGIAQRHVPGQAPKFGISAMSNDPSKKQLNVWIGGELSNIFNHLQMRSYQTNRLKKGTTVQVTGKLEYHAAGRDVFELSTSKLTKSTSDDYHMDIEKWQSFRVLPAEKQ